MAERYFLAILVIIVVVGALYESVLEPVDNTEVVLAILLALLGLGALARLTNRVVVALMPIFFTAALAYELFLYINQAVVGIGLASLTVLTLVGLILGLSLNPKPMPAKVQKTTAVKPSKSTVKKTSKKSSKKRSRSKK